MTIETRTSAALVAALAVFSFASADGARAAEAQASPEPAVAAKQAVSEGNTATAPASSLASMTISFKLDPRLAGGTYGGERWVSPSTYTAAAAQDVVEARVEGADARGRPMSIGPAWLPSDPGMVMVSPREGRQVKIVVKRAGESKLKVVSQEVSMELVVKARYLGTAIQVEIIQPDSTQGRPELPSARERSAGGEPTNEQAALPARRGQGLAERSKLEGEAFLAGNKMKEDVVSLPSGLQYKIVKAGKGDKPTADDTVVCHYRGTFIDGTEFDSSYKSKSPVSFPVRRVAIKGWFEALQLMPVGSKWQLFLPSQLAYGERGRRPRKRPGPVIGPNATLIFEVELLAIKRPGTGVRTTVAHGATGHGESRESSPGHRQVPERTE